MTIGRGQYGAIDVFVDELDLAGLGFGGVEPEATGRPAYHPATLLKSTTSLNGGVLLCSASNTHNRKNVHRSIDEALTGFAEEAAKLREADIDLLGTACGSATFRDFAGSAHFHDQGRASLLSAINSLHDRVDVALR